MSISDAAEFQRRVATIALAVCREQGFSLAGGQALIAHGIVNRATEDIDTFTDDPAGVRRASQTVTAALIAAGYAVESVAEMTELDELFAGFGDDLAELEVRDEVHIVRVQLARFDRHRAPVVMDIGPVLHVDDVLGSKVATLATRADHVTTSTWPLRCEYAPPTNCDGSPGRPTRRSATTSCARRYQARPVG